VHNNTKHNSDFTVTYVTIAADQKYLGARMGLAARGKERAKPDSAADAQTKPSVRGWRDLFLPNRMFYL
jgi:hypothetical protein